MEAAKENIHPTGTSSNLEQSQFGVPAKHRDSGGMLAGHHREREMEALVPGEDSADPIAAWERHTQRVRETQSDKDYKAVLHHCVRELPMERYRSEVRYLRLWIKYAGCLGVEEQLVVLQHLEANRIGEDSALFYVAYATFLEKTRNFDEAAAVYKRGMARAAQPAGKLQENFSKFERRMAARKRRTDSAQKSRPKRKQTTPYKTAPMELSGRMGSSVQVVAPPTPTSTSRPDGASQSTPGAEGRIVASSSRMKLKKPEVFAYDQSLLESEGGPPMCFEECRALRWGQSHTRKAIPAPPAALKVGAPASRSGGAAVIGQRLSTPAKERAAAPVQQQRPNADPSLVPDAPPPSSEAAVASISWAPTPITPSSDLFTQRTEPGERSTVGEEGSAPVFQLPQITPMIAEDRPSDTHHSGGHVKPWRMDNTTCLLGDSKLGLGQLPGVSPLGPPASIGTATPSVTLNTRNALREINSMFQATLPGHEQDVQEPTVTFATRAAMGAIDDMFRDELPHEKGYAEELGAASGEASPSARGSGFGPALDDRSVSLSLQHTPSLRLDSPSSAGKPAGPSPALDAATPTGCLPGEPAGHAAASPLHGSAAAQSSSRELAGTVLDPFSKDLRDSLLQALVPPLEEWPGVTVDLNGECDEALMTLLGKDCIGEFLELGSKPLSVTRTLGTGTFGKCYEIDLLDEEASNGEDASAALKSQSPPCPWEFYMGRVVQGRLPTGCNAGRFVDMKELHLCESGSVLITSLGMYGTLLELVNAYKGQSKAFPENIARFYALDLLQMMHDLHSCNVIHADIKPDNLLIRHPASWSSWDTSNPSTWGGAGLQLIDFGRAIDLEILPLGARFLADCGTECFRCIEMQEGRPWTYQVDCYGVASVIHVMLFGEYIRVQRVTEPDSGETTYRLKLPLKRYWAYELWDELFCTLLNQPEGCLLPPWGQLLRKFTDHWMTDSSAGKALLTDLRKQGIMLQDNV